MAHWNPAAKGLVAAGISLALLTACGGGGGDGASAAAGGPDTSASASGGPTPSTPSGSGSTPTGSGGSSGSTSGGTGTTGSAGSDGTASGGTGSVPVATTAWASRSELALPKAGSQRAPSMAALSSGQRVVAWMDFTAPKRAVVKVQLLAANGTASGTEITVSDGDIINDTDSARVFALPQPDGGFLVAWNSPSLENLFGPPQPPTNWTDYLVKRFDAQGQQVGAEVSLFPPQTRANTSWTARALTGGGAVLLGNFDNDGSATAIVLDGSGNPTANVPGIGRGLSTVINTIGWNVAPTSDGGFVLTWVGENFGPTTPVSNTLYAQRYDHAGAAKEAPQPLFSTGSDTIWTRVVQTTTGNFVVAVDLLDGGPAFGPHRLQVSQFDPAWVHQATTSTGLDASIQGVGDMELAALADGGTLLTWGTRVVPTGGAVDPPGNVAQLVARRFAPSGLPFGDPFTVSDQANLSRYHALVPTADGGAQVALSHAGTSDESDLFVATFGP